MNGLRLIALLVHSLGTLGFGAVIVGHLYRRPVSCGRCEEAQDRGAFPWSIMLVCFVWFAINTAVAFSVLHPTIHWQWAHVAGVILAFGFPPLLIQGSYVEARQWSGERLSRLWAVPLGLAWVAAAVSVVGIVVVVSSPDRPGRWIGPALGILFTAAAIYSVIVLTRYKPKRESTAARGTRRWSVALFAVLGLIAVGMTNPELLGTPFIGELTGLVGRSMPLLFLAISLYYENRNAFFDIVVKRGVWLALMLVALTVYFGALFPSLDGLDLGPTKAWVATIGLLPLVLLVPWSYAAVGRWLDRAWLGRRFVAMEAVQHFMGEMQRATGEDDLVRRAEQGLKTVFAADVHIDTGEGKEPELREALEVPVRSRDETLGLIALGPREGGAPYYSEDEALLNSLAGVFGFMLQNTRLQERRRELTVQASRSELKALRAQINPHFLFNALNAIAGLIHKDPARADRTVEQLAEVFRYTLRGSQSEWSLVEDEIEVVQAYLEVEQARFGERLQVEVSVDEAVRSRRIPTMLVQTLVENAVKHGVARVRGAARIEVKAGEGPAGLAIEVADSGPGFDERASAAQGEGFGLHSIRERLRGHYGGRASLSVDRDADGGMTRVTLRFPSEAGTARSAG